MSALGTCVVPAAGKPSFNLPADETKSGIGIPGEPGIRREKMGTAREAVSSVGEPLLALPEGGTRVALLSNDLGSITPMELSIVGDDVLDEAVKAKLVVERFFSVAI